MHYQLGQTYTDKGSRTHEEDQFLRWINIEGSGMLNSPGIRSLPYATALGDTGLPAYVILVTHERSSGPKNPWDDLVDFSSAEIIYWGDAKAHPTKRLDDFRGNGALRRIFHNSLDGDQALNPPFLHFSKPRKGVVRFNGLCVLQRLETSWFDDHGKPVRNYRAHLTVLDCEAIGVGWLHSRVRAENVSELDEDAETPRAWRDYRRGKIRPIDIWAPKLRTEADQLPPAGSAESQALDRLVSLSPVEFERVVVGLFRQLTDVTHHIHGTRATGDGGFDFHGAFRLPRPIDYEIRFRGEVKCYARSTAVDPKSVSRLVSRLSRQEFGIFVTTSYFTRQAQREVLTDQYPVHLISGTDLIYMLKHIRAFGAGEIREDWLRAVLDGTDNAGGASYE